MSIESTTSKLWHSRGVLCVVKPYTAPTEREGCVGCTYSWTLRRMAAIDMLLLWSKVRVLVVMLFG